jgi:hypothetical protein
MTIAQRGNRGLNLCIVSVSQITIWNTQVLAIPDAQYYSIMKGCLSRGAIATMLTYQRHRAKEIDVESRAPFFCCGITDPLNISQSAVVDYEAVDARECLKCNRDHLFANLHCRGQFHHELYMDRPARNEQHYVRP